MTLITPSFRITETPNTVAFRKDNKGNFFPLAINAPLEDTTENKSVFVVEWNEIKEVLKFGLINFNGYKYKSANAFKCKFIDLYYC